MWRTTRHGVLAALAVIALAPVADTWAHGARAHRPAPAGAEALFARSERFDFEPPRPGTYRLPAIRPAPDGAVLDDTGTPRRLHGLMDGRIVLLSFIYTRCSDANGCPLATAALHRIHDATARDPELARHLELVSVSLDPSYDTPAVMARYGELARAGAPGKSPWHFLTAGSAGDLAPVLGGYGQVVEPAPDGAGGPTHLLRVYLIDRRQQVRNIYGLDYLDPRLLIADVRTLLLEERRR
jgi:cytochrome oxidase Cu insertion factor (SCO1/SenC/PrrC family)